jgi:hypothetical protein
MHCFSWGIAAGMSVVSQIPSVVLNGVEGSWIWMGLPSSPTLLSSALVVLGDVGLLGV